MTDERDAWGGRAAKRLGIDWDTTVIWRDMPVRTESGETLGRLADAAFDAETGAIGAVRLSGGAVADSAIGVRDVEAGLVRGFDGEAIVVSDKAVEVDLSGGVADSAGKTAAAARCMAGEVASAARDGAVELAVSAAKGAKSRGGVRQVGGESGGADRDGQEGDRVAEGDSRRSRGRDERRGRHSDGS